MSKKAKTTSKRTFPSWVRPVAGMVVGGTVGLIAAGLFPAGAQPYIPALGIAVGGKFLGGGSWGKYLATGGVVGLVTVMSQRKTVKVAASALSAAKKSLASGGGASGPQRPAIQGGASAADNGNAILQNSGLK